MEGDDHLKITIPAIIGVQAAGSASIARAWEQTADLRTKPLQAIDAVTVADSISAGIPRDPLRALEAATKTGGAYVTVTDGEILHAMPEFARKTGVFAEPAGSATLAGVFKAKAQGLIRPGSSLVLINTGNGLKDIVSAKKSVSDSTEQRVKKGDLAAIEAIFK